MHWNNPNVFEPSFCRLTGLVGLLSWQNVSNSWLEEAVDVCLLSEATWKIWTGSRRKTGAGNCSGNLPEKCQGWNGGHIRPLKM